MIIKNNSDNKNSIWRKRAMYILLGCIGLYFLYPYLLKTYNNLTSPTHYFCDAETVSGDVFVGIGGNFGNAHTQSSDKAFSGSHSCKLDSTGQYGMVLEIQNPQPNEVYKASIMHFGDKSKIYFACNSNPEANLFFDVKQPAKKLDNGWSLVELTVVVPEVVNLKSLKFFPYNPDRNITVYYDDLKVEKTTLDNPNALSSSSQDLLSLYLDAKALKSINEQREKAINRGILITDEDSWVKGKLSFGDSLNTEVKLRLKGDWTDHLVGDRWSYRVKMPKENGWNGMMEFSLQSPETRFYLKEWLFHKMLDMEDVLTTKYDFIKFKVNDKFHGLYAYEEHLLKQIPESNDRREGVIIKFGEDVKWLRLANARDYGQDRAPYENEERVIANVEAFKETKIFENPVLLEQFEKAHELLVQYQQNLVPVEEIFDIERMAKYYALCDLMEANHSSIWHNQRFYYNPITRKLEPVGFDAYTENGEIVYNNKPFLGNYMNEESDNHWYRYYTYLFANESFAKAYGEYLFKFSQRSYLDNVFNSLLGDLKLRENMMKEYYPDYNLDMQRIYGKAASISIELDGMDNHAIKAYTQSCEGDSCIIAVCNVHRLPISVTGSGLKENREETNYQIKDGFVLSSKPASALKYRNFKVPKGQKYIYWNVTGLNKPHFSSIKPFEAPSVHNITFQKSKKLAIGLDKKEYDLTDNTLTLYAGEHQVNSPIIIPKELNLVINAGCNLKIENDAYILSYGNVQLLGEKENPIMISSNTKNQGFTVMQPYGKCLIKNTLFEGLDRLEEDEWQLTGAVTMYEADVDMQNVTITNNHCEDALNLIRSKFEIQYLNINNTFADGFDSDFCQGKLTFANFHDTGNDALDFSGSTIEIEDCNLVNLGDKGLSGGEQSFIKVKRMTIDGADIGIASKDKSEVWATDVKLINCNKGLSAYQKKPEYGGGNMDVKQLTSENVKVLFLKDAKSKIIIDGVTQ